MEPPNSEGFSDLESLRDRSDRGVKKRAVIKMSWTICSVFKVELL